MDSLIKCCFTDVLADTESAVLWRNMDTDDYKSKEEWEELASKGQRV